MIYLMHCRKKRSELPHKYHVQNTILRHVPRVSIHPCPVKVQWQESGYFVTLEDYFSTIHKLYIYPILLRIKPIA